MPKHIETTTLTEDVALSTECVSIAIGSAVAMDSGGDPVRVLQQAIELWPESVSDHALVIGQRTALALLYQLQLDPDAVAMVALRLGDPATDNSEGNDHAE